MRERGRARRRLGINTGLGDNGYKGSSKVKLNNRKRKLSKTTKIELIKQSPNPKNTMK